MAAGGGDDLVVRAVVPQVAGIDDLVTGLSLAERSATGWVVLDPLWGPALRRLLTGDEADDARRAGPPGANVATIRIPPARRAAR